MRQQGGGRAAGRSEGSVSSTADGEMMAAVIEPLAKTEAPLVKMEAVAVEPLVERRAAAFAPLGEARAADRATGRDGGGGGG